jgi:hypothetical protein
VLQLSKKLWSEELCNPDVKTFGGSWRKLFVSKVQAQALNYSLRLASGGFYVMAHSPIHPIPLCVCLRCA